MDPVEEAFMRQVVEFVIARSHPIVVNTVLDILTIVSAIYMSILIVAGRISRKSQLQQLEAKRQLEQQRMDAFFERLDRQDSKMTVSVVAPPPKGETTQPLPQLDQDDEVPHPPPEPEPELEALQDAPDMDRLTEHFTMGELCHTELRLWAKKNRELAEQYRDNLLALARFLEAVRLVLGHRPMVIHSGFRAPKLNIAVGGSPDSQHCDGCAVDFHVAGMALWAAFDKIRDSGLQWGQLILEDINDDGEWDHIHISLGHPFREQSKCGQVLIIRGDRTERLS